MAGSNTAGMSDDDTAAKTLAAYDLGNGRGVHLRYPAFALGPNLAFRYRGLVEYDYWMMLVGKVPTWAAGREPALIVRSPFTSLDRGALTQTAVQVELEALAAVPKAKAVLRLRRADGKTWDLGKRTVQLRAGEMLRIDCPTPPESRADEYFVDVVVRTPRKVIGSGAGSLIVTSETGIATVVPARSTVERGEELQVTVTTRGTLQPGDRLRLQLRDAFDRVLYRQDREITPGRAEYEARVPVRASASIRTRLEAILLRQHAEVQVKTADFYVPKRRRGQFNFVQWAARDNVLEYYAWQQLAKAGWKTTLGAGKASAAFDVTAIPYCTRLLEKHDKNGNMLPVCWNDEENVIRFVNDIVAKQKHMRRRGTFVYSLGAEGTTKGCCVHPACLDAYRAYLRGQYGTLEALNTSWDSDYGRFRDVDLLDRKDIMENAAAGQGLYAR